MSSPFVAALGKRSNLLRALRTACIVAPLLTLINQTAVVLRMAHGQGVASIAIVRISLTFLVPFTVSLYSSAMADATHAERKEERGERKGEGAGPERSLPQERA